MATPLSIWSGEKLVIRPASELEAPCQSNTPVSKLEAPF
jgi:hypothetical protein